MALTPHRYLEIDCNAVPEHLKNVPVGAHSRGGITSKVVAAAACAKSGMEVVITKFYSGRDTILSFDDGRRIGTRIGNCTTLDERSLATEVVLA